ncbi:MAG: histidine phosphatase family protein [Patescibacteria group bacterium]|nr:histidine phosphatase family protein [Patescibacteria group bacterium]
MKSFDKKYFKQIYKAAWESIIHPGKSVKPLPKSESEKYPQIYVFRHGETFDNKNRIHSGHRDSKLTETGIKQAEILAGKLKNKDINICVTSHLSRSIDTAKYALKYHKNIKYEVDDRIIERDYGKLTGKSKTKLMELYPIKAVFYRRGYDTKPPEGESLKDVNLRVFPFCEELVKRVKENNVNIAISCHGNSMRSVRKYFEKFSILKEITLENPLGQDYARYVIKKEASLRSRVQSREKQSQ